VSGLKIQTKSDDLRAPTKCERMKNPRKDLWLTEYVASTCREGFSVTSGAQQEDLSSRSMTEAMQEEEEEEDLS
jgi:hypothetical protein